MFGCKPDKKRTDVYSVLYDITDPLMANPKEEELLEFVDATDLDKNIVFRFSKISSVDVNVITQLVRPQRKSGLLANAVQEKKRLDQFDDDLSKLIQKQDSITGTSHSSIFLPIVKELQHLASLPKEYEKHLIVYSDLMENSNWMSFYRPGDLQLLKQDSKAIKIRYLKQVPFDISKSKVKLHIIFLPKNYLDNDSYKKLQEVYTNVFNELKIPISFSGNLLKAKLGL